MGASSARSARTPGDAGLVDGKNGLRLRELGAEADLHSSEEGVDGCGSASKDVLVDDMEGGRALALAQRLFPSFLVHVVAHRMCSWATLVGVGFVGPVLREASTNGTHCQQRVVVAAVAMFEAERKTDWTDLSPRSFSLFSCLFLWSSDGESCRSAATFIFLVQKNNVLLENC